MAVWASATAKKNYKCPTCGAKKGIYCTTPSGRAVSGPGGVHWSRVGLLTPEERKLSEIKLLSAKDILSGVIEGKPSMSFGYIESMFNSVVLKK